MREVVSSWVRESGVEAAFVRGVFRLPLEVLELLKNKYLILCHVWVVIPLVIVVVFHVVLDERFIIIHTEAIKFDLLHIFGYNCWAIEDTERFMHQWCLQKNRSPEANDSEALQVLVKVIEPCLAMWNVGINWSGVLFRSLAIVLMNTFSVKILLWSRSTA